MKNRILSLLILSIVCGVVILSIVRVRNRGRDSARAANATAGSAASDVSGLFPPGQRSIHLSKEVSSEMALTSNGRVNLCSLIGVEGAGLDEVSLHDAEDALLKEKVVEPLCIEGVVDRLNMNLIKAHFGENVGKNASSDRIVEMGLLRAHAQEVSEVLRDKYSLGNNNPNSEVLALLANLQIQSSCPDLERSIQGMKQASNPLTDSFDELYQKLCRYAP
jgi:hypothetical protein